MTIQDIENALAQKDVTKIEAAFRTLIAWPASPDALDDAEDPSELACLLDRVTAALEANRHPMPQDLIEGIVDINNDEVWFRDDRSYAAGARAVAAKSLFWVTMFRARLVRQDLPEADLGNW